WSTRLLRRRSPGQWPALCDLPPPVPPFFRYGFSRRFRDDRVLTAARRGRDVACNTPHCRALPRGRALVPGAQVGCAVVFRGPPCVFFRVGSCSPECTSRAAAW